MTKVDPYVPKTNRKALRFFHTSTLLFAGVFCFGCDLVITDPGIDPHVATEDPPSETEVAKPAAKKKEELRNPITFWENGVAKKVEADDPKLLKIDLGETWTPYLFTETPEQRNTYRKTYIALAQGDFPDDHHGARAKSDKYLELFGILPTLGLLRDRMKKTATLKCAAELDTTPLKEFTGFLAYRNSDRAKRNARRYRSLEREMKRLMEAQGVPTVFDVSTTRGVSEKDAKKIREFRQIGPQMRAIRAAQERLACEGYFADKGKYAKGAFDWPTHEALAEFERRNRVYGWGFLGKETIVALRRTPLETEQEAVIRVLTERAMLTAGVLEDGSQSKLRDGTPRTFKGKDGAKHELRNLDAEYRARVIESFGLTSPDATLAWLDGLKLSKTGTETVAITPVVLPEYYSTNMDLESEVYRGDIWYEFPYDEVGKERAQPRARRPRQTIYVNYRGQRIPLAKYGTTIGGWRSESVDGTVMWSYKNSPVGTRVWSRIIASPVWLPPESTPARELLVRTGKRGKDRYRTNKHETGPSYASAYGLVAAYHNTFGVREDGSIRIIGDEGIRSHGSVNYMSIMRRHSHGCHRLHNHMAVRLMTFVLSRRPHRRKGQQSIGFNRELKMGDHIYNLALDQGGHVFQLNTPMKVTVLNGRIRGTRSTPIDKPLPKYNEEVGAYVMPDGTHVTVDRLGNITPIPGGPAPILLGPDGFPLPPAVAGTIPPTPPIAPTPKTAPVLTTGQPVPKPTSPTPLF